MKNKTFTTNLLLIFVVGICFAQQPPKINKPSEPEKIVKNEGCISGDCENGFGTFYYENGYYLGFFKNGKKQDYGVYDWDGITKYIGQWKDDTMDGYGEFIADNDDNIIGMYKNGQLNGLGYSVLNNVWEQGTYVNGVLSQSQSFEKNDVEVGCTYGNCDTGYGYWVYDNGQTFTGFFENGALKMGVFVFESGDKYFGIFNDQNQFEDFGRYFYTTEGASYTGDWKNGVMEGKGYFIAKNEAEDLLGEFENSEVVKDMSPN